MAARKTSEPKRRTRKVRSASGCQELNCNGTASLAALAKRLRPLHLYFFTMTLAAVLPVPL